MQQYSDRVDLIRKRLAAAQSRQKNYADRRQKPLEFEVGDFVFPKMSPTKRITRFGKQGNRALATLDLIESQKGTAKLLISWNCLRIYQVCIAYFMFLC